MNPTVPAAAPRGPRILFAEDDEIQGAAILGGLRSQGYQADWVRDGMEAVRHLRTGQYDLALLDYSLPQLDGLAAARLTRELMPSDPIRLIAVSASAGQVSLRQAGEGGAVFDAVVAKSAGMPALMAALQEQVLGAAEAAAQRAVRDAMASRPAGPGWRAALLLAIPASLAGMGFAGALAFALFARGDVDAAARQAEQARHVAVNASVLVASMHEAETAQRAALASAAPRDRQAFVAASEQLDRMLVGRSAIAGDGGPGFGDSVPATLIENRLAALHQQLEDYPALPAGTRPPLSRGDEGLAAETVRQWADGVADGVHQGTLAHLTTARRAIGSGLGGLGVLAIGVAAAFAARRWLRGRRGGAALQPPRWFRHAPPGLSPSPPAVAAQRQPRLEG